MAPRLYAALECAFGPRPDDESIDRLLAELDDGALVAVEDHGQVWRAFYDSTEARDRALASWSPPGFVSSVRAIDVSDEEWAERSQASLGPIQVGDVVIAPPWHAGATTGPAELIIINPAMGFGTGHHASTRLCLSLLQRVTVTGQRVLDVGTGSGVLAIAARRLGASAVVAIDPDRDALDAAGDSLVRNGTSGVILEHGDLASWSAQHADARFDGALANLTGATLQQEAGRLAALVRDSGWLIASGVEGHEAEEVSRALSAAGWHDARRENEGGWVGLCCVRRTASPTPPRGQ